jgi:hypothetical protein
MTPDPPAGPPVGSGGCRPRANTEFAAADPGQTAGADPGQVTQADPRQVTEADKGQVAEAIAGRPEELYELGGRLLEAGEAARAAEVFTLALERVGADHPGRGQLLGGLGIARLEQALAAFAEAAECGDASVRPLAVELLARGLPLRDRDNEAAVAWQRGVSDRDPEVAAAVRARLRRGMGTDGQSAPEFWWDGFMESAVCHGTLPVLANELFGALDQLYALVAVPYARHARERELWQAVTEAVRVPSAYAWGPDLQESFRERLRDAIGAESDVLPPDWPETG